jgi:hypothetical protein
VSKFGMWLGLGARSVEQEFGPRYAVRIGCANSVRGTVSETAPWSFEETSPHSCVSTIFRGP